MVKHIVLWKVKDSAEKQQNIERMTTMLNALVGKIEGLVSVELGYNFNTSSDYDVVLYATLKSASALRRYQNHPEHVKCKDFIGSITESRVAADYFYDEETAAAPPYIEDEDIPAETQAAPEPEAPKGPEITVEFPPKREILPAPSIPKAAPVSAPADSAAFSEDKLYHNVRACLRNGAAKTCERAVGDDAVVDIKVQLDIVAAGGIQALTAAVCAGQLVPVQRVKIVVGEHLAVKAVSRHIPFSFLSNRAFQ